MHLEQLRKRWRACEAATPIDATMRFNAQGLVLGAGAVLAANQNRSGRDIRLEGGEARLLALLGAAYGRVADEGALGHIRRAAERWNEGDDARAALHLALARLGPLEPVREAAHRMFLADALLESGFGAEEVLKALNLDPSGLDWARGYNDQEPRVPKGQTGGGRWTDGSGDSSATAGRPKTSRPAPAGRKPVAPITAFAGPLARPAGAQLSKLTPEAAAALGRWALRIVAAAGIEGALALGLALVPTNGRSVAQGQVPGRPNLRYFWNREETFLRVTGPGPGGVRQTVQAHLGTDGVFRDPAGQAVARVLKGGVLAIDTTVVAEEFSDQTKDEGPKLCPAPMPDRPGNNNPKDRIYEDFVKRYVNGLEAAPTGWGVALPNLRIRPRADPLVIYDDCEHDDGAMIEAKGRYGWMRKIESARKKISDDWLDQAERQIIAAEAQHRPVVWYFRDLAGEEFAHNLFYAAKDERLRQIQTRFLPMSPSDVR